MISHESRLKIANGLFRARNYSEVLVLYNSLGRAAAIAGEQPRALQHFHDAVATGAPGSEVRLLAQARITLQY